MVEDEFDIPLPPGESETPATKENREQKKPSVIQAPDPKEFSRESSKAVKVETAQKEKDTSNRKTERRSNLHANIDNKEHSRKTSPRERKTSPEKNEKLKFTFIVQGLDQREKIFPSSIIKHTKTLPTLTFCGNPRYETGVYKSRKEVLTSCETALKELMEKIMGGCAATTDMLHQASMKGAMSEGHHCRPWYSEKVNPSPKTSNKDKGNTAEKNELQSSGQLAGNSGSNIQRYSPNWSSDSRSPSPELNASQSAVPVSSIQPVVVVPKIGLKLVPKTRVKIDLQIFDDDEKTEDTSTAEEKRTKSGQDQKLPNKNDVDQQTKRQKAEDDDKSKEQMKPNEKESKGKEGRNKESSKSDSKNKESMKREEAKKDERRKEDARKDGKRKDEKEATRKEERKREENKVGKKEDARKDERKREENEGTRKEDSRKDERKREVSEGTRKEDSRKDERKREVSEGTRKEDLRKDERKRGESEGTRKEDSRKDERKQEESEGTRKEDSRKDERKREESEGTRKEDSRKDERKREESGGTRKEESRKDEQKREESEAKRKETETKDERKREEKDSRKERDRKSRERDREHQHEARLSERDRGRSDRTRSRSPSRSEKQGKQMKPDSRNLKRRKSPEIQRNERKRRRSGSHQKETTNGKSEKTQTEEKLHVSPPRTPLPPEDVATVESEKRPSSPVGSTEQVNESTGKQSPKDDSEELSKRISLDERLERELGIKALVSEPEPSDPEPLTTSVQGRSQEPLSLECYQFAFMSESEMENFSPVQRRGFGPKAASMGPMVFSCPTVFPFRPYIPPHIEALLFNRPVSVVPQPAAEPITVELAEEKIEEVNGEQPENAKDPEDWDGKLKLLEEAASNLESGDETVLEDIEEKLLLFEAMSIVPGKELSPPPVVRTKQKRSKPKPIILKPAEKGILVMPVFNLDENAKKSKQKSVVFADNIKPGDGSSSSGGEELHSPPPPTETAPENLKKRKRKKKKLANNDDDGSDSEFDKLPPPPPPPGSPPPHLLRYRLPVDTPVDTPADTEEPIPVDSPPPPPPGEE